MMVLGGGALSVKGVEMADTVVKATSQAWVCHEGYSGDLLLRGKTWQMIRNKEGVISACV